MSDSNSQANQDQTTEQQDNRIAAAPDSVSLVASRSSIGGNVNIVSTDHNSVSSSFDFAKQISKDAASQNAASIAAIESTSTNALDHVTQAYGDVTAKIASAYTEAKAGEQKVMVAAGLAIVGIVALKSMKG